MTEDADHEPMSFAEKSVWSYGVVTLLSFAGYVTTIVIRAGATPLERVSYGVPLVVAVVAAIVSSIVATMVVAFRGPRESTMEDERDVAIFRAGEVVGYYVLSVGVVGALVLTLLDAHRFWIGNAIYASFVMAALASVGVRLRAYRSGGFRA